MRRFVRNRMVLNIAAGVVPTTLVALMRTPAVQVIPDVVVSIAVSMDTSAA